MHAAYSSYHSLTQDAQGAGANWNASRAQLPPVWVDRVDSVEEDVRQIQLKMRELSSLHTKRLMVSFDDASEQHKEREIELLTQVSCRVINITLIFLL
jgi:hypothetical protein